MYITEVAPIAKIPLPSPQVLSYFTSQKLKEGSLVIVPLKKKKVAGLVIGQNQVEKKKIEIKKAEFRLRPVLKVIRKESILFPYQISLAKWISNYYWAPLGKTISLFLPNPFLKKILKENFRENLFKKIKIFPNEVIKEFPPRLYIAPFGFLPKREINNALSKKKQILLLIPEKSRSDFWMKKVKKIISQSGLIIDNICFFSTNLPPRKYLENFRKIREGEIKVIIGTRSAIFAPFLELGLIVLLEPESKNYKSQTEPRYNAKDVAMRLADMGRANLLFVSSIPSIEDYIKFKRVVRMEPKFPKIKKEVVDMKSLLKNSPQNVFLKRPSLSPFLVERIQKKLSQGKKILLFINRKGKGLSVVCQDCGWIQKCQNCEIPLVLHKKRGQKSPIMICHYCGFRTLPSRECKRCKSWRLITLGEGIEKTEEELKDTFRGFRVLRLDKEVAPAKSTQNKILKEFLFEKGNILLTTSLLLGHLPILLENKIQLVGVVSLDTILSLPDFRNEEEGVKIVYNLLSFTSEEFVFQTLWPDSQIANFIKKGFNSFLKNLLKEREKFLYPPFSQLIKISFSHKNSWKAEKEIRNLKDLLEEKISSYKLHSKIQILGPTPSFIPKSKGKYKWNIVLKLDALGMKDKRKILNSVSPQYKVDIEPLTLI